ncbi:MAG: putative quinol monooxygenase [Ruegeria sp.]
MSQSKVYLRGFIQVPMDRIEAVRAALPEHISLTRAEPGCLSFDVFEDAEIPGRFNVSEVFENRAAFDAHQARTKQSPWAKATRNIPRSYDISTD